MKVNTNELIMYLRDRNYLISVEDTYELDIMFNRLAKARVNIKSYLELVLNKIESKNATRCAQNIIYLFLKIEKFKPILNGLKEEAKEKNKQFDKLLEEIEKYG